MELLHGTMTSIKLTTLLSPQALQHQHGIASLSEDEI